MRGDGDPAPCADDVGALDAALAPGSGLRVVEVRTDRAAAVELDRALRGSGGARRV